MSKQSPEKKLHLAYQEYISSIEQFADSLRTADIDYIADAGYRLGNFPMTIRMKQSMDRYVAACSRLRDLNAKKA